MHTYLVHYGEIALKGRNRPEFELQLVRNIKRQHPVERVERLRGRMVVHSRDEINLSNVLGVAWWAMVSEVEFNVGAIREQANRLTSSGVGQASSFAVRVSRADKSFPLRSRELEELVGGDLDSMLDIPVNLDAPEFRLSIEIAEGRVFMFTERQEGPRGLPSGISGKLVGLYSAGIDSAVAAYLMGKRGASVELVHFHALSDGTKAHEAKAGDMARAIAHYFPALKVHYVPYHHFQLATGGLDRHQRQELVVFRRFMARVGERLARQSGALGLFSGDNLGQVASQTLENLGAVDDALTVSMFRPLIAYDKQEIIDLGKSLGLDDLANEPYKDCCSIIARHPATRANMDYVHEIEQQIGIGELMDESISEMVTYVYSAAPEGSIARELSPVPS